MAGLALAIHGLRCGNQDVGEYRSQGLQLASN
jgi:hypothetical protein